MAEIRILGAAAEIYGESFSVQVANPSEAMRALEANYPGFLKYMDDNKYKLLMMNPSDPEASGVVDNDNRFDTMGEKTMFIVPSVEGDFFGIDIAIAGAIMSGITASAVAAGTLTMAMTAVLSIVQIVLVMAVSMAISLISSAIMGSDSPSTSAQVDPKLAASYLFNGVVNTAKQGGRVPLLYGGPLLVGSMTVSARLVTQDIPV